MAVFDLLRCISRGVARNDGALVAECFTPVGIYDDYLYGRFQGHYEIAEMVGHFHRDGSDYRWDFTEAVQEGSVAFASYKVSFVSKAATSVDRIVLDGISRIELLGPLIAHYSEVFDRGMVFSQQGFLPERIAKLGLRYAEALKTAPGWTSHIL
jgi:hypothetical protein